MNNISLASVVALATGLAIAGDVKNDTVTCARFEPGTVIDYSCWASDGAKDGEAAVYVFIEWGVGGVKDSLAKLMAEGKIPEGIAVSFNAGTLKSSDGKLSRGMRAGELDQPGAEYPSAIAEEIVPSAEKLLGVRASKSPDLHFITGASSGGIAAWNACWFRNDWFRRCYCNSPTFSNMRAGTQLMALVRKCETRPIRVYLTCGTDEPDYFFGDSYFVAADAVGALRFAGYELRFERYPHFGHGVMWGNRSHLEKVLTWLFEDWRTKPVAVVTNPLRVRDATARGSTWESCDFQMPPAAREARSSDRWRRYTVAPDNRFVMSERVRPDGAFDQRVRLAPLELAWNATRVGGTALTVAADDRIWVATELGVQGMVSFGLADVVLPLPGDLPCDNVALVGTTLYASSGDRVFRRSVKVGAADPANPSTPATPGYDDGFWYSRDHEPAGGVGELIGSYVTAGRIAGAVSAMCDGDGGETYACEGWSVYGGRNRDRLSPDTLFTIGATVAIFRSVALMCALDEGKRSLDEIGEPYEAYLRRKVLAPLGLKDTTFAPDDKQRARLAKTYNSNDERIRLVERPVAPGELYSSPRDLLRLAQLIAHRGTWEGQAIVSRKTFDRVWSGITGDPRIDLRVDAKTGRCAVFCIQTDSTTGSAFLQLKRDWHAACDIEPRTDVPW